MSLFSRIGQLEREGARAAVVTVVRTSGSTPRSAGARMIVYPDGRIEGTIGGGKVEHSAIDAAIEVIERGEPQFLEFKLTQELGMCCGGAAGLFIEPIAERPRLIIFGAGHVGSALARSASTAGFAVAVADERSELLEAAKLPPGVQTFDLLDDPDLPFTPETFVMITTHDHALDQRLVEACLPRPHRWLGVIGSRRKAELTRKRLAHRGHTEAEIATLRCPVGLMIGAETPEEIAISILAELIARRRAAFNFDSEPDALSPRLETKAR